MDTPTDFVSRVTAAVLRVMEARNCTQASLSEATGIPRTTLIRKLRGHSDFTVRDLERIAAHLGVSVTTFTEEQAA